jgi:dihydroorotate dehydrogenase
MAVGASAVQIGTANFSDPRASETILEGLEGALGKVNTFTFSDIRDRFLAENG